MSSKLYLKRIIRNALRWIAHNNITSIGVIYYIETLNIGQRYELQS